jgi:surface antigen
VAHSQYGYPYPNAPDCNEYGPGGCVADQWAFFQGQCTSWVAYRLNQLNGFPFNNYWGGPGRWGNASNWGAHANALGIPVNGSPGLGSVAWYASGHVGYVEQVNSPTSVVISEMNFDEHNGFRLRTISPGNGWPSGFVHMHDRAGTSIGEGSFVGVAETGRVYRIAGGAPIYVSNWNVYGGPQPTITISAATLASMRTVPADGTFVGSQQTGRVYRIVGGAPTYVSDWAVFGGPQPTIGIDQWALDRAGADPHAHLNRVPADGVFLSSAQTGRVYRVAGGAPTYVSDWAVFGGGQSTTSIDQWSIDRAGIDPNSGLNRVAVDGAFVSSAQTGRVYRIVGGAPTYVSDWAVFGGPQPTTTIDQWAFDQAGRSEHAGLNRVPADGVFLSSVQTGRVYRVAGGAPTYVSDWAVFGGGQPTTSIDQWSIDRAGIDSHSGLNDVPADGTFIASAQTGAVYRIAGGAPFYVTAWSVFGGAQPLTAVDQWALDQAGSSPHAHLRAVAADGTLLEGLPSGAGWRIQGGRKTGVAVSDASVAVDDWAISQVPDAEQAVPAPPAAAPVVSTCARHRAAMVAARRRVRKLKRTLRHVESATQRKLVMRRLGPAKKRLANRRLAVRRACG